MFTALSLLVCLQPFLLLIDNLGWDDGTLFKNSTLKNMLENTGAKPEPVAAILAHSTRLMSQRINIFQK